MAAPPLLAVKAAAEAQKALKGDIYTRKWVSERGIGKKKRVVEHELHVNPVTAVVAVIGGAIAAGLAVYAGSKAARAAGYDPKIRTDKPIYRIARVYDAKTKTIVDAAAYDETIVDAQAWDENVNDQWIPEQTVNDVIIGYHCNTDGAEISSDVGGEGLGRWMRSHKGHDVIKIYGTRTYPGYWTTKVVHHPEQSHVEHHDAQTHDITLGARVVVTTLRGIPVNTFTLGEGETWNASMALSKREKGLGWKHAGTVSSQTGTDSLGHYDALTESYTGGKKLGLVDAADQGHPGQQGLVNIKLW
jgi:hypothetical protein